MELLLGNYKGNVNELFYISWKIYDVVDMNTKIQLHMQFERLCTHFAWIRELAKIMIIYCYPKYQLNTLLDTHS